MVRFPHIASSLNTFRMRDTFILSIHIQIIGIPRFPAQLINVEGGVSHKPLFSPVLYVCAKHVCIWKHTCVCGKYTSPIPSYLPNCEVVQPRAPCVLSIHIGISEVSLNFSRIDVKNDISHFKPFSIGSACFAYIFLIPSWHI